MDRVRWVSLSGLAAASVLMAVPSTARACSPDGCVDSGEFSELEIEVGEVVPGGVIPLSTRQRNPDALPVEEGLARLVVTVTDGDGANVPGALEESAGVYFWRPESPFVVGQVLSVALTDEGPLSAECGTIPPKSPALVTVAAGGVPGLVVPSVDFQTSYTIVQEFDVESAVCCDGAFLGVDSCGGVAPGGVGFCTASRETGIATGTVTLSSLAPSLANSVAVEFIVDGVPTASANGIQIDEPLYWSAGGPEPIELQIRVTSLIDGTTLSSEVFTSDGGQPEALGPLDIDIAGQLEVNCIDEAYSCDEDPSGGWDADNCEPYGDDSDTDDGSETTDSETTGDTGGTDTDGDSAQDSGSDGCSVGGGAPVGTTLMLFALAAIRRRKLR